MFLVKFSVNLYVSIQSVRTHAKHDSFFLCVALQAPVGVLFRRNWRLSERQVLAMNQSVWKMVRGLHLGSVIKIIAGVLLKVAGRSPSLAVPA